MSATRLPTPARVPPPPAAASAAAGDHTATSATALSKEERLRALLAGLDQVLVAFSGGVDSTYLLAVAQEVLGPRVRAVTADSPSLARRTLEEARTFCAARQVAHLVVATTEFEDPTYRANDGNRCAACKSALLEAMRSIAGASTAAQEATLVLGVIADDLHDHRPGIAAARAAGARFPLADVGLTKDEIRLRSQALGLPTWDRPAEPCLSSRVPYGEPVTPEAVRMIEAAERCLHDLGFRTCRARHHRVGRTREGQPRGYLCRIEVPEQEMARVLAVRAPLLERLRAIGYGTVALDLAAFSSGSLNALLRPGERQAPDPS